jgi:hypothetical protein
MTNVIKAIVILNKLNINNVMTMYMVTTTKQTSKMVTLIYDQLPEATPELTVTCNSLRL